MLSKLGTCSALLILCIERNVIEYITLICVAPTYGCMRFCVLFIGEPSGPLLLLLVEKKHFVL